MALEGNDWLYLGGALLGGAALGALIPKKGGRVQGPPYIPFLRRSYKDGDGKSDIEARIGAAYEPDEAATIEGYPVGYLVQFVGEDLYGEGVTSDALVMRFTTLAEAMDAADGFIAEERSGKPVSNWQLTDEVKKRVAQKEPAGIWMDSADLELEGARKRGKKKSGWY